MFTQLTVRLPEDLSREVNLVSRRLRLKRSDIVRLALEKYVREVEGVREETPYQKVKNLLGVVASGIPDLGESHRKYLIDHIKKHV